MKTQEEQKDSGDFERLVACRNRRGLEPQMGKALFHRQKGREILSASFCLPHSFKNPAASSGRIFMVSNAFFHDPEGLFKGV